MNSLEQQLQKANRLSLISEKIGFALWQLQELEGTSAQFFVLLAQASKGMGLDKGNALVENLKGLPFGATVRKIRKEELLSAEMEERLIKLLSERNWLVHRSRGDSRSAIHNDLSMQKLMKRVDTMAYESLLLLKEIGALSKDYVKEHGVTEEYINIKARELLDQWHSSDEI